MNSASPPIALGAGLVAPGFEPLVEAFCANFLRSDDYREIGAAFCVVQDGQVVVNLAAGRCHTDRPGEWQDDTLVNVYSTTKGVTALVVALLVQDSVLDYEAPVARYWPQFAAKGKGRLTVAQLLSHQSGLAGFREPLAHQDLYDRQKLVDLLAAQAPFHTPGEATCYHPMSFGFLVDELVRRADGRSIRELVRDRFHQALGIDVFIGCPGGSRDKLATLSPPPDPDPALLEALPEDARAALTNPQVRADASGTNAWLDAELPAANGHASAEALARLFSILANGGNYHGQSILGASTLRQLCQLRSKRTDRLLQLPMQWCAGLARNTAGLYGPARSCFGHSGWGGSFACADTEKNLAMAYVCNHMGAELVGDPRTTHLCNTVYRCLEN